MTRDAFMVYMLITIYGMVCMIGGFAIAASIMRVIKKDGPK